MAVKIQVEIFWIVTPCSVVVAYHISEVHDAFTSPWRWR